MTVRNGVLGRGQQTNAGIDLTLCTVPAGQTFIVKDVHVWNKAGVSANITIYAASSGFAQQAAVLNGPLAAGQIAAWDGTLCLAPGDELLLKSDQNSVYAWASGADLLGSI